MAIAASKLLGTLDEQRFEQIDLMCTGPQRNDLESHGDFADSHPPFFAFLLPAGIDLPSSDDQCDAVELDFYKRLNRINTAFEDFFEVPDDECLSLASRPTKDEF